MKWFQHQTHSHTDLALRVVIAEYGLEGYGFYWICCELVGQQGDKYRLNGVKGWLKALKDISKLSEDKIKSILDKFSSLELICRKSLKKGELYIPKMSKYSDDYTKQLRRRFEVGSDNIRQEENRIDKNRLDRVIQEYITLRNWQSSLKDNPSLLTDIYKRNCKAAKNLLLLATNDEQVLQAMRTMANDYKAKNLTWTLETVIKHYPDLIKPRQPQRRIPS